MICRRCGMESSTTDNCEWCKKPMLPPGGAISMKAKEELLKQKEEGVKPQETQVTPEEIRETAEEAAIRRPESKPPPPPPEVHPSGLLLLGSHLEAEPEEPSETPNYVAGGESKNEEILLPLGSVGVTPQGEEAKDTPIYIGNDENVLRPIERPVSKDGAKYMIDSSGRKRRIVDDTPEIPEKVRLMRATIRGAMICFPLALLQFFVPKPQPLPTTFIVIPLPGAEGFLGAISYGVLSTLLNGFMLSALLVAKKWGPVAGFFIGGLGTGTMAMLNTPNMPWSMITGALCGIFCGIAANKGVKRVVNV